MRHKAHRENLEKILGRAEMRAATIKYAVKIEIL